MTEDDPSLRYHSSSSSSSRSGDGGRPSRPLPMGGERGEGRSSHRPNNPFKQEREKENFPDLDMFFGNGGGSGRTTTSASTTQLQDVNQSYCSQEGSSILNMSIGARAALNEHLRHVEKFGIDGEKPQEENEFQALAESAEVCSSSKHNAKYQQEEEETNNKNALDAQWDKLLDSSGSNNNDTSGSFARVLSNSRLDNLVEESMEIGTDVSNDYFNSSRVMMALRTPERNFNRPDMVMTRQDMQDSCLFEEDSDFTTPVDNSFAAFEIRDMSGVGGPASDFAPSEAKIDETFAAAAAAPECMKMVASPDRNLSGGGVSTARDGQETSFHSFCANDLSRISNSSGSQHPGLALDGDHIGGMASPPRIDVSGIDLKGEEDSFLQECHVAVGEFSPVMKGFDTASTSRINDSSFSSTPQGSPQRLSPHRKSINASREKPLHLDIGLEFKMPTKLSSSCKRRLLQPRPIHHMRRDEEVEGVRLFSSDLSPCQKEPDHQRRHQYSHRRQQSENMTSSSTFHRGTTPAIARARSFFGQDNSDPLPAPFARARRERLERPVPMARAQTYGGEKLKNRSMSAINTIPPKKIWQALENTNNDDTSHIVGRNGSASNLNAPIARARRESLERPALMVRARTYGGENLQSRSMSAIDIMPKDFMHALGNEKIDELSPISGGNGSSTILNGSKENSKNNTSTDSSSHKSSSLSTSSGSTALTGRKRYRTVVPVRVFLDSPSKFPEEHDSFSSRPSSQKSSHNDSAAAQRSLLDSFDGAAGEW